MQKKHNEGFSLVETLIAITILALIVIPTCSGIIMAYRMNAKADELMQAQLAVSSAVETLMAEGIPDDIAEETDDYESERFPNVTIKVTPQTGKPYYKIEVTAGKGDSTNEDVSVTTSIRAVDPEGGGGE